VVNGQWQGAHPEFVEGGIAGAYFNFIDKKVQ